MTAFLMRTAYVMARVNARRRVLDRRVFLRSRPLLRVVAGMFAIEIAILAASSPSTATATIATSTAFTTLLVVLRCGAALRRRCRAFLQRLGLVVRGCWRRTLRVTVASCFVAAWPLTVIATFAAAADATIAVALAITIAVSITLAIARFVPAATALTLLGPSGGGGRGFFFLATARIAEQEPPERSEDADLVRVRCWR